MIYMRRKKKARRGWRKKKRKPALASSIPGFVAAYTHISNALMLSYTLPTLFVTPVANFKLSCSRTLSNPPLDVGFIT